ncbi:serine/threonine-protein kinase [Rubripirellula amarantea]|nr:serine/threonine-protein kinase [Rubripirellula amarantea]
MNHTHDRRVLSLFEQALDLPPGEVDSFLDDACGDDTALRGEVVALLATQKQVDEFLPAPSSSAVSTDASVSSDTNSLNAGDAVSQLDVGLVLADRYRIEATIGTGGMGEVYRATDMRLDRAVAIKVLKVAGQQNDQLQKRFDREMKSVAGLSHPNVMTLHDIADHGELKFAVMELVVGKTLRQVITDGMDWQSAVTISHGIAMGLAAAHAQGLMHRDIKPDNVIVANDGLVKVLDFGIARPESVLADQELTVGELQPGTIPYMSPEQANGKELTCATDIFSFGTMLYEMVTGVNPFRAPSALQTLSKIGDVSPPPISDYVSELPADLVSLISAMLRRVPSDRPTAAEVAERCASMDPTSVADTLPEATASNLPMRAIELTGRDNEVADIAAKLSKHPIVTISGPGGVGKTSIATTVARNVMSEYHGGVWMCEFAPVRNPDEVTDVLASVLDGNAGSKGVLDQVVGKLQRGRTLLIFDNCEHVIDSVAELAETLSARLPELTILATSRESLNVGGEHVCRLEGLACEGNLSDAANLFVTRAASLAGYVDDPSRRGLVEQIVTRLDGLPLAIELAAPRLTGLSLEELHEALDDQLSALQSPRRSKDRQSTLERAIEWSFDLLDADEQRLLLDLSVFTAAFTGTAAVQVGGLKPSGKLVLQRLVEQSVIVRTERKGVSRYRLLEPIRQFCHARIEPEPLGSARQRHAFYFSKRAEVLALGISGQDEIESSEALNAEWSDLREAVAWGREHVVVEVAVDPVVALSRTVMFHLRTEAYQWLMQAEQLFGDEIMCRADVNAMIGNGHWVMANPEQTERYLDRADEIELTSLSLLHRYFLHFGRKQFAKSAAAFDRSAEIAVESGDPIAIRWASLPMGCCPLTMANPSDPRLDPTMAEASKFVTPLDWPTGHAWLALAAATIAVTRLDTATAFEHRNRVIELSSASGNRWMDLIARMVVNDAADPNLPPPMRLSAAAENLRSLIDLGEEAHYPLAARSIVIALIACGQYEDGVRCSAAAESLVGVGDRDEFTSSYPSSLDDARSAIGEAEFSRLREQDTTFTIKNMLAIAQQFLAQPPSDG